MNKEEAKKWMVENHLAENEFSAGAIWEGLTLWKFDEFTQQLAVYRYRELRGVYNDTKVCYAMTLKEFKDADNS